MLFYPDQEIVVHLFRKIVTGELRALAAVIGAVIYELEEIDALARFGAAVGLGLGVLEIIAERISREAEQQARRTGAFERFNRHQRIDAGQPDQGEAGFHGGGEEFSPSGGLHELSNRAAWKFCESGFWLGPNRSSRA